MNRSLVQFATVVTACAVLAGCTLCQNARRTVISEPNAYSWKNDRKRSVAAYRAWADQAWYSESQVCPEILGYPGDYLMGFRDGFVDYVYAGGSGEPPPVPPRLFWNVVLRSPDGKQRVEQWFAGYRHGARVAREGGYRELGRVQSSLAGGPIGPQDYTQDSFDPADDQSLMHKPDGETLPEPSSQPSLAAPQQSHDASEESAGERPASPTEQPSRPTRTQSPPRGRESEEPDSAPRDAEEPETDEPFFPDTDEVEPQSAPAERDATPAGRERAERASTAPDDLELDDPFRSDRPEEAAPQTEPRTPSSDERTDERSDASSTRNPVVNPAAQIVPDPIKQARPAAKASTFPAPKPVHLQGPIRLQIGSKRTPARTDASSLRWVAGAQSAGSPTPRPAVATPSVVQTNHTAGATKVEKWSGIIRADLNADVQPAPPKSSTSPAGTTIEFRQSTVTRGSQSKPRDSGQTKVVQSQHERRAPDHVQRAQKSKESMFVR